MKPARTALALIVLLTTAGACGSSYADPPRTAPRDVSADRFENYPDPSRGGRSAYYDSDPSTVSPYHVELVGADSATLPTFPFHGKAYVMGTIGERYRIHITNPTAQRVEAVISVDGLDAVDGKVADHDTKRGYILAPFGELTLDGFRTSLEQVATFRFSSVRDSYAGRQGADRNVGVIGVAFFPERRYPVRAAPRPLAQDDRARESSAAGAPAKRDSYLDGAPRASKPAPAPSEARSEAKGESATMGRAGRAAPESRPGLGTEFGERRYSTVEYTKFERESPNHPQVVRELRYNDREGLVALGVPVDGAYPSSDDLSLRESADPFPRNRFAAPPPER